MGVKMEVNSSPELVCFTWTMETKFPFTAKHYNLKNKAIFNPWEFLTIKACLCPPIALQKSIFHVTTLAP